MAGEPQVEEEGVSGRSHLGKSTVGDLEGRGATVGKIVGVTVGKSVRETAGEEQEIGIGKERKRR